MTQKAQNTAKLGLFILVGTILFIIAVYLIGSKQNMFGTTIQVSTIFNNVNGLQPGNNVRYAGINVGTVDKILFLNDTTLLVKMKLKDEVSGYIRKDAIASIGSDGLVGSMLVNISPGSGDRSLIQPGDTIDSYSRVKTEDMLNTLGKSNENIALISNNLLQITQQIKDGKGIFSLLIQDTSLAKEIRLAIHNIQYTSAKLSLISRDFHNLVDQIEDGDGLINQLLNDTMLFTGLQKSFDQLDTLINTELSPTLENLRNTSSNIEDAGDDLKALIADIESGKGAAGVLLRDSLSAENIRNILQNLETSTRKLDENMEAMRDNFLFRRYFRKKEKAGE